MNQKVKEKCRVKVQIDPSKPPQCVDTTSDSTDNDIDSDASSQSGIDLLSRDSRGHRTSSSVEKTIPVSSSSSSRKAARRRGKFERSEENINTITKPRQFPSLVLEDGKTLPHFPANIRPNVTLPSDPTDTPPFGISLPSRLPLEPISVDSPNPLGRVMHDWHERLCKGKGAEGGSDSSNDHFSKDFSKIGFGQYWQQSSPILGGRWVRGLGAMKDLERGEEIICKIFWEREGGLMSFCYLYSYLDDC